MSNSINLNQTQAAALATVTGINLDVNHPVILELGTTGDETIVVKHAEDGNEFASVRLSPNIADDFRIICKPNAIPECEGSSNPLHTESIRSSEDYRAFLKLITPTELPAGTTISSASMERVKTLLLPQK